MAAQRSRSIAALDRNIKAVWPGVVVGWIGNQDHAQRISGHNPDDTPGVRAELTDADTLQEVRSLDVMFGPAFGAKEAQALVRALVSTPSSRSRLFYVIYNGKEIGRGTHWSFQDYDGDPHTNHVHISGWAEDDANGADWPTVLALGDKPLDVNEAHQFLSSILAADTPAERQVRDMIRGGNQLPEGISSGLLSDLARTADVTQIRDSVTALVAAIADLANRITELETAIGQGGNGTGGPTPAEIAAEIGTRLSNG